MSDLPFDILCQDAFNEGVKFEESNLLNMRVDKNSLEVFPELSSQWKIQNDTIEGQSFWRVVQR